MINSKIEWVQVHNSGAHQFRKGLRLSKCGNAVRLLSDPTESKRPGNGCSKCSPPKPPKRNTKIKSDKPPEQ